MRNDSLFGELARRNYPGIEVELSKLSSDLLIELLNDKSVKIGDVAASLLINRGHTMQVINAAITSRLKTKIGKVRALNIINRQGRSNERSVEVYLHLLCDRSPDVVSGALFGLVFLQDLKHVSVIRRAAMGVSTSDKRRRYYHLAIDALEKRNPLIFSPYFRDQNNVWK